MSKRPYEGEAEGPVPGAPPLDVKKAKMGYGNSDMKTLFCRNLEYSATEEDLRNIRFFSNWRAG